MSSSIKYPIFVFSAGWRSGSTMLQRLLVNTGDVLMWGESGGALNHLRMAYESYEQMLGSGDVKFRSGYGGNGEQQFDDWKDSSSKKSEFWIACMNPHIKTFQESFKGFMENSYARDAQELSFSYWGIKDVLADLDTAKWLKRKEVLSLKKAAQ